MSRPICSPEPILAAPLLRQVDAKLIELLRSLSPAEWDLPTVAPGWRVRHVAAHLLDTALRKLSVARDGHYAEAMGPCSPQAVVELVNRLNLEGVRVYGRLSPALLIDLLVTSCSESARFHEALDPFAVAAFAVSWAGEETSLNWFDTARELTERWHHQQQIRMAVGRPGIMTPELFHPVLDCFVRGLPYLFRDVDAPVGTAVLLEISGECGGRWVMARATERWQFVPEAGQDCVSRVKLPQQLAWQLFTKAVDRNAARREVEMAGNPDLAERVLQLTAIVG